MRLAWPHVRNAFVPAFPALLSAIMNLMGDGLRDLLDARLARAR